MAIKINNLTLDLALELLQNNYVLSKKSIRFDRKAQKDVFGQNILQLFFKDEKYHIAHFDSFGNKIKSKCKTIAIDDIKEHLNVRGKEAWTQHKQRIAKKENDNSIVDEETAKILVYDWLLKKYKNEDDVIVPEITLGSRRADYVAFGKKEICIIEIKSEVDTIERLQEQINQYIKYGNLVYIAIHKSKITSIDSLNIPDFVGIIEITKKLKVIKKPKKQKADFAVFQGFVSYQEFSALKNGFKGSSTITKMDMEIMFDTCFSDKQKGDFLFELMKNRHKSESKKRLDVYRRGDFKKAVGNARGVGIDRLSQNVVNYLSLKNFFSLNENFIYDYIEQLNNQVVKLYAGFTYIDLLKADWILLLLILRKLQIPYRSDNSKIIKLSIFIENSKVLLDNKEFVKKFIDSSIQDVVLQSSNTNSDKFLLIETHSKESQKFISDKLRDNQINYESTTMNSSFYGILKSSDFKGKNILVMDNKIRKYFHLEKDIEKIELWDRK